MPTELMIVTGARGFVGRHVAKLASDSGATVIGLGHGAWTESEYQEWGLSYWLNGEVASANLDALAKKHGLPSTVLHLAGGSSVGPSFDSPHEDFRRSVQGCAELAEWIRLRAPKCKAVLASSAAVYGSGHREPIAESTPTRPFSPYGFHKKMSETIFESYAANFGLQVGIVRLFSVYGPGARKQLLWDVCSRLSLVKECLVLGGTGNERRDWLHIRDASALLVKFLDHAGPQCPIVNGGTGVATSVDEIARELCRLWGSTNGPAFSGKSRVGDPEYLVANTEQVGALRLTAPINWKVGLADYVSWFKSVN